MKKCVLRRTELKYDVHWLSGGCTEKKGGKNVQAGIEVEEGKECLG